VRAFTTMCEAGRRPTTDAYRCYPLGRRRHVEKTVHRRVLPCVLLAVTMTTEASRPIWQDAVTSGHGDPGSFPGWQETQTAVVSPANSNSVSS
jgi:hypothetical protein